MQNFTALLLFCCLGIYSFSQPIVQTRLIFVKKTLILTKFSQLCCVIINMQIQFNRFFASILFKFANSPVTFVYEMGKRSLVLSIFSFFNYFINVKERGSLVHQISLGSQHGSLLFEKNFVAVSIDKLQIWLTKTVTKVPFVVLANINCNWTFQNVILVVARVIETSCVN